MVEIKTTISFNTYKAVIDKVIADTFINDIYNPEYEDCSFRLAVIQAFAPDYKLSDDIEVAFEQVYSEEAQSIIDELFRNPQFRSLQIVINKAIQHRLSMVENGSMSLTDYALSKFVNTLNEKVQALNITDEGVKAVEEAVNKANSNDFAGNVVDAMLDRGMLAKPNRQTRRANGQTSKSKKKSKEPIELKTDKE